MNILQLTKDFNQGGLAIHISELAHELSNRRHNVIICSSGGNYLDSLTPKIKHINIIFDSKNLNQIIRNFISLSKVIKREKIEIIHSQNRICSLYIAILSLVIKTPYIWSMHQDNIPDNFFHRFLTFTGKKVICTSSELKQYAINHLRINENKVKLIHNGINLDPLQAITLETKADLKKHFRIHDEKVITLLGRLTESKGQITLLNAISKLANKEKVKVILVGEGNLNYTQKIRNLIKELKLEEQVVFAGFIPAYEVLSITDLMVLPSTTEGFPLAVLNAFASEVPVIRTRTGGFIDTQEYCIAMDFFDNQFLKDEIDSFLNGKDYINMVKKAAFFVENNCTIQIMTDKITELYAEVV